MTETRTGKGERCRESWRVTKEDREGREMQRELESDRDNSRQGRERDVEIARE